MIDTIHVQCKSGAVRVIMCVADEFLLRSPKGMPNKRAIHK